MTPAKKEGLDFGGEFSRNTLMKKQTNKKNNLTKKTKTKNKQTKKHKKRS